MTEKTWQTYVEAATTLGLTVEGIRQRARREHWRKMLGNDGKALVMLPEDAERAPAGKPDGDVDGNQATGRAATGRQPSRQPDGEIAALQARVDELREDLERERIERERERAERLQERDRADGLTGELSAMARELARIVEDAGARERGLQGQLINETAQAREERDRLTGEADVARRDLAEWRARSWWKRLAG